MINLRRVIQKDKPYSKRVVELRNIYIQESIVQIMNAFYGSTINGELVYRIKDNLERFFCLAKHEYWFKEININVDVVRSNTTILLTIKWTYMTDPWTYGYTYEMRI